MRGVFLGLCLLFAAGIAAEEPPADRPTFSSGASLVAVDARVVDGQGRPVSDLGPGDFTLSFGGRPRTVAFASYRDHEAVLGDAAAWRRFSTNEGMVPGRFVVLVVDQGSLAGVGRRGALTSAERLLDRLTVRDRAALVTLPKGSGPTVDFTADTARIRQALDKVAVQARAVRSHVSLGEALSMTQNSEQDREVMNRECMFLRGPARMRCESEVRLDASTTAALSKAQTQQSIGSLRSLMSQLRNLDAPKTMVLVSGGLLQTDSSALETLAAEAGSARVELLVLLIEGEGDDASVGRLMRASSADARLQADGLERLASLTGGALFRISGSGGSVYDRLASELSGSYMLAFEAEEDDRDGRPRDLRLSTRRPGVTVRARRTVAVPRPPAVAPTPVEMLASALRGRGVLGDLPIRVATYTVREPGTADVRLLISAEVGRRGSTRTDGLSVGFMVRDAGGRVVASGAEDLPDAPASSGPGEPAPFVGAAVVPAGSYVLRLAATDRRGLRGSVDHPVKAGFADGGQIATSDLILSGVSSGNGRLNPGVDPEARDGGLLAYLELYGRDPRVLRDATVAVELAGSESGPALVSFAAPVASASEPDRRIAQASLPIDGLPGGDYIARAVVSVAGQPVRRVMQPFRVPDSPDVVPRKESPAPAASTPSTPLARE